MKLKQLFTFLLWHKTMRERQHLGKGSNVASEQFECNLYNFRNYNKKNYHAMSCQFNISAITECQITDLQGVICRARLHSKHPVFLQVAWLFFKDRPVLLREYLRPLLLLGTVLNLNEQTCQPEPSNSRPWPLAHLLPCSKTAFW